MATYLALNGQRWRKAEAHLRIISAFDPGLRLLPVQRSVKTLFGFSLKEIAYSPVNVKSEGQKVLHSVVNFVSTFEDVLILPLEDMFEYSDPSDVALIKLRLPWVDPTRTRFFLSEFGGGLTTKRTDPAAGDVWSVEYDCQQMPRYEGHSLTGSGFVEITRPQILFHELVHVDTDGDPLVASSASSLTTSGSTEGLAIIRENAFRLSQNPSLKASHLRSTVNIAVRHTY